MNSTKETSLNPPLTQRVVAAGKHVFIFLAYLVLAIALQWASGAYSSEWAAYDDEPSHYVTGLMLRDYLASLFPDPPMKFAEQYYLHYPKVGFGHWPPAFYVLEAGWLLLFSDSRACALTLIAVFCALLALLVYRVGRTVCGDACAVGAGAMLILLPLTQAQTSAVMVEVPLAFFSLLAALAYSRYLQEGRKKQAVQFGILACLAIMTKGEGWALSAVPPIAVALGRRFTLVRSKTFWLPAVVVALICVPFYAWTLPWAKHGMASTTPSWSYFWRAMRTFASEAGSALGMALLLLSVCGLWLVVVRPLWQRRPVQPLWVALTAYMASAWLFNCVVPSSTEPRKLYLIVPAFLLFALAGLRGLTASTDFLKASPNLRMAAFAAVVVSSFFWEAFYVPARASRGFRALVQRVMPLYESGNGVLLVSSNTNGEGMLVAEVASQDRRPRWYVLRASQHLAQASWDARQYRLRYRTPQEVMAALLDIPVSILVLHTRLDKKGFPHHALLRRTVEAFAQDWELMYRHSQQTALNFPPKDRARFDEELTVYSLRGARARERPRIVLELEKLGKRLEAKP